MKKMVLTVTWDDEELNYEINNPEPMSGKDTVWILMEAVGLMMSDWDKEAMVEIE